MKNNKLIFAFALLIVMGALYRIIPGRPMGFAPQIAMALFGGAVLKDKKWAFSLPLFSMFLSDGLYEILYRNGLTDMPGFYEGQGINYLLLAGVVFIGSMMNKATVVNIASGSIVAPVLYFIASNGVTWLGHGGYNLPMTASGLLQTYILGLPFFYMSVASTLFFSFVLFGAWHLLSSTQNKAVAGTV